MLNDKNILITGGTGSLGTALIEELLKTDAAKIIVYSRDEYKQHQLQQTYPDVKRMRWFIGDVRDRDRLHRALSGVHYVIHTAAMKHVGACEYNPREAIKTNIEGTQNIVDACIDTGVKRAIITSSDKSVNASNLYGATKYCAEKLFVDGNVYSNQEKTQFSAVRLANFIGSRGSVIEKWNKAKEFLELTDKRMKRFWITLPEAAQFMLKCLEEMRGGEIFIPKMSEISLEEVAKSYGLPIKEVGMKKGEKLRELLFSEYETFEDKGWAYVSK